MQPVKILDRFPNAQWAKYKGKDLLRVDEFSGEELMQLLELAAHIKKLQKNGQPYQPLQGKTLGMIFDKSSTRTRVSFEVGMYQLGGMAMFLSGKELQLGRGEPISDTAKVMSRYVDAIMIRTFSHAGVEELAEHASIPIINGLTDDFHPCQALADMLTIWEHKGKLKGIKLAYVGDGNNVANSLVLAAVLLGMDVRVATPPGYEMNAAIVEQAKGYAQANGGKLLVTHDPVEAVKDADAVYTDVWTSMGFEAENEQRLQAFAAYQVNENLVSHASPEYLFLHCLPAHRGEEVSAGVIDGANSVVFDQAENRLHAQKAVLAAVV
ncbi:ornithine carbamoyltransferase [Brevibacillus borstelensis]|uniref:ornithine carbamoyltransferase n=1 Tax=Brevibacillus TaxID=55080 RepID=UPI00148FB81A|nr:ornithine carbamoyltransferase [Brevibacillus borstelensis]MCM3470957.1 ornithine carbamoyltransferase [Brevibacillus borstelensis]MCM3559925.1 ornithine carbamoyltransferase [Brevibacillus borstelensis]MCM3623132.1 ornithine carbamoyltransferase [Brevibacillus borstelensis]MED1872962.1 ornithine carbamoyltransferase [Brevibacillus borstelensis]NOU57992.1 ornithine carbamoyltransferase [Brevibacillus borstelensis]